jgi:hypothetical protein
VTSLPPLRPALRSSATIVRMKSRRGAVMGSGTLSVGAADGPLVSLTFKKLTRMSPAVPELPERTIEGPGPIETGEPSWLSWVS